MVFILLLFITLSQGLVQPCHCLNHCKQPCHKLVKDFYSFVVILCQERLLGMLKFVHIATDRHLSRVRFCSVPTVQSGF